MEPKTVFLLFFLNVRIAFAPAQNVLLDVSLKVYANGEVPYGKKTAVMVTLAKLPRDTIVLQLGTPGYLVLYQEVGRASRNMPLKFSRSYKISEELKRHKIVPSTPVSYEKGYYVVVDAKFWTFYASWLILKGSMANQPQVKIDVDSILVIINELPVCVPELSVSICSNHENPHVVVLKRGVDLVAEFDKSCGIKRLKLNWTITDLMERQLESFPDKSIRLTLKPYALKFRTKYELWRNRYVILIKGENNGTKFAGRCYLETLQEKVEAIISGGKYKKVKYSSKLIMDATASRDYSKPKTTNENRITQFQIYFWDCHSDDDNRNPNCYDGISVYPIFEIPANSFRLGKKYTFRLRVMADDNPKIMHTTIQTVEIVNVESLDMAILCRANCERNRFNAHNKMVLKGACYDCGTMQTSFYWYIENKFTLNKRYLATLIDTNTFTVEIKLVVRTRDGRVGIETRNFRRHRPPIPGKCEIKPTEGFEAIDKFFVSCKDFTTNHKPLEYFYYADRVLLNVCQNDKCASHLPLNINSVKVLICDSELTCARTHVKVKVNPLPNIKMETPQKLWEFITTPPNDVVGLAARGKTFQMMATIQALAERIDDDSEMAMVFMRAFDNVHPKGITRLGKLANLTHTLALRLTPISSQDQCVLIRSLCKLNEIFQNIHDNQMSETLLEEPYINVTASCITVFKIMERLNKQITRPPQAIYDVYMNAFKNNELEQPVIDKLLDVINGYSDEGIKGRTLIWLNSTWETERLYRFLQFSRNHEIQHDNFDVQAASVSIKISCISTNINFTHVINTIDRMHTVYFSPELIQETRDPDNMTICIKVISTRRELNWWYPEDKQPSTVLLTVHIYTGEDNFKQERYLKHSSIKHRTVFGKYKPATEATNITLDHKRYITNKNLRGLKIDESDYHKKGGNPNNDDDNDDDAVADTGKYINCLEHGVIKTMQGVRVYRINLDEQSMLVVRFRHTTHRLRALLIMDNLPKLISQAISKSGFVVPADSRNTTMLIRNNCLKWHRVYLALHVDGGTAVNYSEVPGGPVNYSFVFQVRSCDYWMYSLGGENQRWSHVYCLPGLEFPQKDSIECTCTVLGTYTSYVFHVPATIVPTNEHMPVSINWWYTILFFLVLLLLILWIIALFIWYNKPPNKTILCDMTGLEDESQREVHDLYVYLRTGGRVNALTTASVRLVFQTQQRTELHFTLMQDPQHPELTRNSTYVLWLRTRDIRIPTRVAVSHDNAGRYPTWFLRRIELVDLQEQLTQVFIVQRWLRDKFYILSSTIVFRVGDHKTYQTWRERFTYEFERQWVNWGLWQPLSGNWRESAIYDSMTRAQRASIFIVKMVIIYCVCACYLGPTTPETLFAERKKVASYPDLIKMFMISFVFTNLAQYLLQCCIFKKQT